MSEITREAAWNLLTEFTQSESLRKHALAVEACMRTCSKKYGEGSPEAENLWGVVGLIHDFDYERWPDLEDHPYRGNEILKQRGLIASRALYKFAHGAEVEIAPGTPRLFGVYHPSQQNTQTGRVTPVMYAKVLTRIKRFLER